MLNGFRLSGNSNPVPLDDGSDFPLGYVSEINLVPFVHGMISLWNGRHWQILKSNTRIYYTLPASISTNPTDVFAFISDSGQIQIELGNSWSTAIQRAGSDSLARKDGVLVKAANPTRLYVGTICGNSSNQCVDTPRQRFIWNMYNQVDRSLFVDSNSSASWSYGSTTIRSRAGLGATSTTMAEIVLGQTTPAQGEVTIDITSPPGSGVYVIPGVGIDSTSTFSTGSYAVASYPDFYTSGMAMSYYVRCNYAEVLPLGYHTINWNERASSTNIIQVHGKHQTVSFGISSHLRGKVRM